MDPYVALLRAVIKQARRELHSKDAEVRVEAEEFFSPNGGFNAWYRRLSIGE